MNTELLAQVANTPRSNNEKAKVSSVEELEASMQRHKQDWVCPSSDALFDFDPSIGKHGRFTICLRDTLTLPTNRNFNSTMFTRLATGLKSYASHLVETDQIPLLLKNANDQLAIKDKKYMIRAQDNASGILVARAFLGDTYKRIDDELVFDVIKKELANSDLDFELVGGRRTMDRTYFNIISKEPVLTLGERSIHIGFTVSTSDTGGASMQFTLFACDGYCLNGMRFNQIDAYSFKAIHRGPRLEQEFGLLPSSNIIDKDDVKVEDVIEKIKAGVRKVTNPAKHREIISLITKANEAEVTGESIAVIEKIAEENKFSDLETAMAREAFREGEDTLLGIQSSITRMAQEAPSFTRRVELEQLGGRLLTMPEARITRLLATVPADEETGITLVS
jgi:hypothetical protein